MLLYPFIEKYLKEKEYNWLFLSKTEQDQIYYLIGIFVPFAVCTQSIGLFFLPTIQFVFPIYNKLLTYLKDTHGKLSKKQTLWKQALRAGLILAKDKIKEYYGKIKGLSAICMDMLFY